MRHGPAALGGCRRRSPAEGCSGTRPRPQRVRRLRRDDPPLPGEGCTRAPDCRRCRTVGRSVPHPHRRPATHTSDRVTASEGTGTHVEDGTRRTQRGSPSPCTSGGMVPRRRPPARLGHGAHPQRKPPGPATTPRRRCLRRTSNGSSPRCRTPCAPPCR
jgi:hypothetical protein